MVTLEAHRAPLESRGTPSDGPRAAAGYDRLASVYPALERFVFGQSLDRMRRAHFEHVREDARVLLLGDGVGRSLVGLLRRPGCRVHSVDISAGMLRAARRRVEREGLGNDRVAFEQADVELWCPPDAATAGYDVVVTPFFLDLFEGERLDAVVQRLAAALRPGGLWLVAEFRLPEAGWRRLRARLWLWLLYRVFRLLTSTPARRLEDAGPAIERQGLVLLDERRTSAGLLMARCYGRSPSAQAAAPSSAEL